MPPASNTRNFVFRFLIITVLIISFWMSGLFVTNLCTSYGLWYTWHAVVLYAVSIPLAYIAIRSTIAFLELQGEVSERVLICIAAAVTILHGITITAFPHVYGSEGRDLIFAGGWLLYFSGCATILIMMMYQKNN
ncbi:hypothetical protein EBR66_05695 [bacterium]|nr:hypothetical protein [bacterium]